MYVYIVYNRLGYTDSSLGYTYVKGKQLSKVVYTPDVLRVIEQVLDYCKALADTDRQTRENNLCYIFIQNM